MILPVWYSESASLQKAEFWLGAGEQNRGCSVDRVLVLQDEKVLEIRGTKIHRIDITLLNCTLKIGKMVDFILCVFYEF